ncbi:LOB domain-containing protein 12-like [Andrographis paniculata]|uniref:LOB domain-containing protein 12-like n=1 Tax=Andrographis paniculata TaxID=175694 RepID=UPI0021E767F9|nr:LOB domain-containing protein 12-like [Andrographis paniculata]
MGGSPPCASCKLLRRRCAKDCIFAPYFPSNDPHKFAIVHKVFGASNVSKMLQELPAPQRPDAVSSLVYEANARARDPVYGCVGAISFLQSQVSQLEMQLAVAKAQIFYVQMQHQAAAAAAAAAATMILDEEDGGDDRILRSSSELLYHEMLNFGHHNNNNNNNNSISDLIYYEDLKESSSLDMLS